MYSPLVIVRAFVVVVVVIMIIIGGGKTISKMLQLLKTIYSCVVCVYSFYCYTMGYTIMTNINLLGKGKKLRGTH